MAGELDMLSNTIVATDNAVFGTGSGAKWWVGRSIDSRGPCDLCVQTCPCLSIAWPAGDNTTPINLCSDCLTTAFYHQPDIWTPAEGGRTYDLIEGYFWLPRSPEMALFVLYLEGEISRG